MATMAPAKAVAENAAVYTCAFMFFILMVNPSPYHLRVLQDPAVCS